MCAVSAVGTYFMNTFPQRYPDYMPSYSGHIQVGVTQEQFEALRKEVQELKELLLAAKKFDDKTGQHDCEQEEKVALIKQIAKLVGVEMKDIFPDT